MVQTVLLTDADVLIDYRESEIKILELVVQHMGRVVVLAPVLDEVQVSGSWKPLRRLEAVDADCPLRREPLLWAGQLLFEEVLIDLVVYWHLD